MIQATIANLQTYLGDLGALPDDPDRMLLRAQELIYSYITVPLDETDEAIDRISKALISAQCAQVEYWMQVDESVDIVGPSKSMTVFGGFNQTLEMQVIAPRAKRVMMTSGLLNRKLAMGGRQTLASTFFDIYDNGRRML